MAKNQTESTNQTTHWRSTYNVVMRELSQYRDQSPKTVIADAQLQSRSAQTLNQLKKHQDQLIGAESAKTTIDIFAYILAEAKKSPTAKNMAALLDTWSSLLTEIEKSHKKLDALVETSIRDFNLIQHKFNEAHPKDQASPDTHTGKLIDYRDRVIFFSNTTDKKIFHEEVILNAAIQDLKQRINASAIDPKLKNYMNDPDNPSRREATLPSASGNTPSPS